MLIVSPNLITNKSIRSQLPQVKDASTEVSTILTSFSRADILHEPTSLNNNNNNREEDFTVSAKIFLDNFDLDVETILKRTLGLLETTYLDNLILAVPKSAISVIGITSGNTSPTSTDDNSDNNASTKDFKDDENRRNLGDNLIKLWKILETQVESGVIRKLGLCDVQIDVLTRLCNEATVKPSTIQVNTKTCCVVPPEIQAFTKENNMTLLTHNDPPMVWNEEDKINWVVRYQVHFKSRGVLYDKRYVIYLN